MPDETAPPRKTKLEKIAELEARLKLSEEENRLLRKEVLKLKGGSVSQPNQQSDCKQQAVDPADVEKMKMALRALKRVTVKQEHMLQSMREKANSRRDELVEKDDKIAKLKHQLKSMDKSVRSMEKGDSVDNLRRRIRDLEGRCYDEKQKKENAESKSRHLEKKIAVQQQRSLSSHGASVSSGSSDNDSNIARMKQELAKKSSRIVSLEYELEGAKEELLELRRQADGNISSPSLCSSFQGSFQNSFHTSFQNSFQASFTLGEDGFPSAPPMGSDPFNTDPFLGMRNDDNLFSSSDDESDSDH